MKAKKNSIIILSFIFFCTFLSYSNESSAKYKDNKSFFSFENSQNDCLTRLNFNANLKIRSNIRLYGMSNSQLTTLGLVMGIVGSAMTGTGAVFIIPGSILMWASWAYYGAPYAIQRTPSSNPGYHIWFSGIGFLVSGITLIVLGVPLAIIGFILYFKKGRLAALIKSGKDETRFGFAIKL